MNQSAAGWSNGLIGILIFSGSLPATRVAVGGFDPLFLTSARAVIAAFIGIALLVLLKQRSPNRQETRSLIYTAFGVVLGFPLLTALALQHITAAHSTVYIGLLPLATAVFGVIRGGERPSPVFWFFSCLGSLTVVGFALTQGAEASFYGDGLMLAAIIVCGFGYAEGAILSKRLGGWQVISWSLAFSLPAMLLLAVFTWPESLRNIALPAWFGLGYVSAFSMMIGFIFWYRGLALGGITGVGQLQLLQPFFSLILAAFLLGEAVSMLMIGATVFVVACVAGAKKFA